MGALHHDHTEELLESQERTELAVVADTFHLKPLLRHLQSADRYQVLGLSRHEAKLFEGNRDTMAEAPWPRTSRGPSPTRSGTS